MPGLMRKQTTKGAVEFSVLVPREVADTFEAALSALLDLAQKESSVEEGSKMYTISETFDEMGPGNALRALRRRQEMTQAGLADVLGISKGNISAMELGKRTIGIKMAKRLASALETSYKVFL